MSCLLWLLFVICYYLLNCVGLLIGTFALFDVVWLGLGSCVVFAYFWFYLVVWLIWFCFYLFLDIWFVCWVLLCYCLIWLYFTACLLSAGVCGFKFDALLGFVLSLVCSVFWFGLMLWFIWRLLLVAFSVYFVKCLWLVIWFFELMVCLTWFWIVGLMMLYVFLF